MSCACEESAILKYLAALSPLALLLLMHSVLARDHAIKLKAGSATDGSQFWKSAILCFCLSFSHFIFHTGLALQAMAPSGHFQGYNQWGMHYVR